MFYYGINIIYPTMINVFYRMLYPSGLLMPLDSDP